MIATHNIQNITFSENIIQLIIDGKLISIPLDKISPSGYGIHWPLIDEDFSVDALLHIGKSLLNPEN